MRYIDADTIAQCYQALRDGKTLEHLAGRLHCDPGHLANLLGEPSIKPVPVTDEADLWSVDRLDGVL